MVDVGSRQGDDLKEFSYKAEVVSSSVEQWEGIIGCLDLIFGLAWRG